MRVLRVTDLDQWAWFQAGDMTDAELLARLRREEPPGAQAIIGTCFHDAMERAGAGCHDLLEGRATEGGEEWRARFFFHDVRHREPTLNVVMRGYPIAEAGVELALDTAHGPVMLRGRIDGMDGGSVIDLKTAGAFRPERYQDAWQWRAYLAATGRARFEYRVFVLAVGRRELEAFGIDREIDIRIRGYHTVACWRYPAMLDDLRAVAGDLAEYLQRVGA